MLKGDKYFYSTPFPDKTDFFWVIFDYFCWNGIFSKKNRALSRTSPYGSLAPYKVSEKTDLPIPRKLPERTTDGRTDGRKDGQKDTP